MKEDIDSRPEELLPPDPFICSCRMVRVLSWPLRGINTHCGKGRPSWSHGVPPSLPIPSTEILELSPSPYRWSGCGLEGYSDEPGC